MGLNPGLRQGRAPAGEEIFVPPFNGILVEVPRGKSLKEVATTYGVRPDVLFEVNGCQRAPQVVFVPGVNWSPIARMPDRSTQGSIAADRRDRYPLPAIAPILRGYGWQINPASGKVEFHPGLDLAAPAGTSVLAIAAGVVAFAGDRGDYGNLVVINHPQGWQTRYAQLASLSVTPGEQILPGTKLGTVGATGAATQAHLHFELRQNSPLGWVAQNPTRYLEAAQTAIARPK